MKRRLKRNPKHLEIAQNNSLSQLEDGHKKYKKDKRTKSKMLTLAKELMTPFKCKNCHLM